MPECQKCPLYISNGGYYGSICYGEDDICSCVPKHTYATEQPVSDKTPEKTEDQNELGN